MPFAEVPHLSRAALLVIAALVIVGRNNRKASWIGLVSLLFVLTTLFPHTLLPNQLGRYVCLVGGIFLFTPVLLADALISLLKRSLPVVLLLCAVLAVCVATVMEYTSSISQGMMTWLRKQENLNAYS